MSYYDGLPDVLPGYAAPGQADPNAGTDVRMPDGTMRHFGPGQQPKIFIGSEFPGGWAAAVPGTPEYDHYSSLQQRSNVQGVAKVGALVGGGALLGHYLGAGAAGSSVGGSATTYPLAASGPIGVTPIAGGAAGSIVPAAGGAAGVGGGMNWLDWANLGSTVLGAVGANKAADAQVNASKDAIAESRRQFDTARSDLLPTIQLGQQAAGQLSAVNSGAPIQPNMLPGYEFMLGQGQQAIDRKLSSIGLNNSGAAVKEGARFATGLADSNFGSFYNRLLASAGLGQTSAATSANAGANSAAMVGNASEAAGNARASGYANAYGALQGGVSNLLLSRYLGQH